MNVKKNSETIAGTFTSLYDAKEDRLRLIINYQSTTTRVDFWITRSLLTKMLPLLSKYGSSKSSTHINNSYDTKREAKEDATDNSTLQSTQKDAVLLEQVDFAITDNGVNICFSSPKSGRYSAVLTATEVDAVLKMLIKAAPTYEWGIGPWWLEDI